MEQTDIVPVLSNFEIQIDDSNQLVVMNPPVVEQPKGKFEDEVETSIQ
jgi:hypothetical protein